MSILGIASVSAAALMLEVALSRLFSIAHGQELSYMVISLALLGYGIATPFLCRLPRCIQVPPSFWALGLSLAIPSVLFVSHLLTLDSARLAWEKGPWLKVGLLYFLLSIPFLFSGLTIASFFMRESPRSHFIYAGDLIGAGMGAIFPFFFLPLPACYFSGSFAALGGFLLARYKRERYIASIFFVMSLVIGFVGPAWEPKMSPSRGLPTALLDPNARLEETLWSSWTRLDLFTGAAARVAPGLSLNYLGSFPLESKGIAIDGDVIIPRGVSASEEYLDYLPQALPYKLYVNPSVLLIQSQGGVELAEALFQKAGSVEMIENDKLFKKIYSDVSGVRWQWGNVRIFLEQNIKAYDMVVIGGLGATGALSSGFFGTNQNFNLTQEFFEKIFHYLSTKGTLIIHLYRLPPPRLELRLFRTILEGLKALGLENPASHVVMVQSLQTYTFLVRRNPLSPEELSVLREFVASRGYEILFPDKHLSLESDLFHRLAKDGLPDYPFITETLTDNRPFPYQSIRFCTLPGIIELAKGRWQLVLEGGGLSWAILLQALLGSCFILFLAWSRRLKKLRRGYRRFDFYFLAIGFGFILLEVGWMNRCVVLLAHPAEAVPLVLGGVLVGAGVGSWLGAVIKGKRQHLMLGACIINSLIGLFSAFLLPSLLRILSAGPRPEAFLLVLLLLGSVVLGMPFPCALSLIPKENIRIPWLWGLNACASVVGAVLAAVLLPFFGFRFVFILASFCYLMAAFVALGLSRPSEQTSRQADFSS